MNDFLYEHNAKNLVKENLVLKVSVLQAVPLAYQTIFQKVNQKSYTIEVINKYYSRGFFKELSKRLERMIIITYDQFHDIFIEVNNKHSPPKKKTVRANHKPYMTKYIRKTIMWMSALQKKLCKEKLPETERACSYTRILVKKEKREYFSNLRMNNYTDNKKYWNTDQMTKRVHKLC